MLASISIGSLLITITTVIHAVAMQFLLWQLKSVHAERWAWRSDWSRVMIVSAAVLGLFLTSLLEVAIWSATYVAVGALSDRETALYFSMVTFTSLGYGDVVLPPEWRLLASFEAANGIILFGWTTALIFLFVQRLWFAPRH